MVLELSIRRWATALTLTCTDEDAMHWPEEDIGNLRVALNALMRVFRM